MPISGHKIPRFFDGKTGLAPADTNAKLSDMKPRYPALSDAFLDGPLDHALRFLPPHERRDFLRLATEDHADDRSEEPTVTLSVRVPISLAVRIDIERANVKRALRQRRATRSDTVRFLLEQQLAELDRQAVSVPAQPPMAGEPAAEEIAA